VKKNVFSDCLNVDPVQSESLNWSGSKFQAGVSGDRLPCSRVCYVDGNDVQKVVADDW